MATIEPSRHEREFDISELFFSVTDHRGVIESSNEVFVRLSGYPLETLVGSPHSIIRHPDMPRAVFKLLWDTIKAGKSIVAYVKNMAVDGSFYWVLALVVPIDNRYLSIRLKPSSQFFPIVKDLYQKMRTIELDKGDRGEWKKMGMEVATQFLIQQLNALGFSSYEAFMHQVLREEIGARDIFLKSNPKFAVAEKNHLSQINFNLSSGKLVEQLSKVCETLNKVFEQLDSFVQTNKEILDRSQFLSGLSSGLSLIAINSSIEAARLGNDGRALSVVAQHLKLSSNGVSDIANSLLMCIGNATGDLINSIYQIATARLQSEMLLSYAIELAIMEAEQECNDLSNTKVLDDLQTVLKLNLIAIEHAVAAVITQVNDLLELNRSLSKSVISLQFAQVTGAVESSRLTNGSECGGSFGIIFDEVKEKLEDARQKLQELAELSKSLNASILIIPKSVAYASSLLNNGGARA